MAKGGNLKNSWLVSSSYELRTTECERASSVLRSTLMLSPSRSHLEVHVVEEPLGVRAEARTAPERGIIQRRDLLRGETHRQRAQQLARGATNKHSEPATITAETKSATARVSS